MASFATCTVAVVHQRIGIDFPRKCTQFINILRTRGLFDNVFNDDEKTFVCLFELFVTSTFPFDSLDQFPYTTCGAHVQ
jgi:hypothetical protein